MSDEPKHIDVTRTSQPVSHTSRPIITGHQPIGPDPMMKTNQTTPSPTSDEEKLGQHVDIKLTPTGVMPTEQRAAEPKVSDQDLPASVIETKAVDTKVPADKVQELIDKKTYQVPISATPSKRLFKAVIIVLAIALVGGAIAAYLMMK